MNLYGFIVLLFLLFGLANCATTHPGDIAKPNNGPIVFSVINKTDLSDKYYWFLEFTIENKSSDWKTFQLEKIQVESKTPEILTNEKLSSWIEGAELKLKKSNYNKQIILGSVVAVGSVAALTSNSNSIKLAGAGAAVGASSVAAVKGINKSKVKASSGKKAVNLSVEVPATHALVPTKIPPESFVRRWIVVQNPQSLGIKASDDKYKDYSGRISLKIDEKDIQEFSVFINNTGLVTF